MPSPLIKGRAGDGPYKTRTSSLVSTTISSSGTFTIPKADYLDITITGSGGGGSGVLYPNLETTGGNGGAGGKYSFRVSGLRYGKTLNLAIGTAGSRGSSSNVFDVMADPGQEAAVTRIYSYEAFCAGAGGGGAGGTAYNGGVGGNGGNGNSNADDTTFGGGGKADGTRGTKISIPPLVESGYGNVHDHVLTQYTVAVGGSGGQGVLGYATINAGAGTAGQKSNGMAAGAGGGGGENGMSSVSDGITISNVVSNGSGAAGGVGAHFSGGNLVEATSGTKGSIKIEYYEYNF